MISLSAALLLGAEVYAQAEQTPENLLDDQEMAAEDAEDAERAKASETESEQLPVSNEVDFNEENFRRSMELRDRALQRSPDLTTGSYSRDTGVQALNELPEASQKHLREQLREVIVQNGPWTPEEAGKTYPYVPSAEAEKDGSLSKREEAAWGELVARYHEREAAIHANSARSRAATASGLQDAQAGDQAAIQPGAHSDGSAESGETSESGKPGRHSDKAQRQAALESMLDTREASAAGSAASAAQPGEQGVSQNALELLTERQQLPPAGPEVEAGENEPEETELEFDTEGVIAIEDLEKINLDADAEEKE